METHKADASFSYKHFRAYQPLNTYWAEHDLTLHSEFRDSNVPAGFEQRRVLQDALALLPDDVETVSLGSDSAGIRPNCFSPLIDKSVDETLDIHLIVDNYVTHKHAKVQRWLKRHPRFHMHFAPTSSSWLNMAERFFRDITTQAIRRGVLCSVDALMDRSVTSTRSTRRFSLF